LSTSRQVETAVERSLPHSVKLDVFEGPLDLLLHLITRRRVDIYEVPLATIAGDYLAAVLAREDLDLEAATGFLVVAATLVELKSARLLPAVSEPEEAGLLEERDALLARLVECATYREAGTWLGVRLEEGSRLWPRTAGLEPPFVGLAPDPLATTSPEDLARAAASLLAPRPEPELDVGHLAPPGASVRAAIVEVAGHLRRGRPLTFRELCRDAHGRVEVVARFLALLELFKSGAIDVTQAERFGDIRTRWTDEVPVEVVLADVEEYSLEGEVGR
jgi:segregation and condensation protein A